MLYSELEDYAIGLLALVRRVVSINYDETTKDIKVTERSTLDMPKEYVYVEETEEGVAGSGTFELRDRHNKKIGGN